jgi:uracil-DNA glycosylase
LSPRIAIIGEAWGEQEALVGKPFFGPAGQELTRMLHEAGIDRNSCLLLNLFNFRPANNDISTLCTKRNEVDRAYADLRAGLVREFPDFPWPNTYDWPAMGRPGSFLSPSFLSHLATLVRRLQAYKPDLVFLLGNTPAWALLRRTGIGKIRGYEYKSPYLDSARCIPTYHPAAVLRQYSHRPLVVADFSKGLRLHQQGGAGGSVLPRTLWVKPGLDDLSAWWTEHVRSVSTHVAVDIETAGRQITSIAFGTSTSAICIPFVCDDRTVPVSYWPTFESEVRALEIIREWLGSENPKIFQNALYDLQWIWRVWGFPTRGCIDDTMLVQHALQPEMAKDLGFLGSAYTDERAWKDLGRHRSRGKSRAYKLPSTEEPEHEPD